MTTQEKLQSLISRCKASVSIEINQHRDYYLTIEESIAEYGDGKEKDNIDSEVFAKMIESDTCVEIQFYPRTPIGFFKVYHYDVDLALDECLLILDAQGL
jgi:hypothetical protein